MPVQEQSLTINFAQGIDTKTDPKQVQPGKFLELENSIFDEAGLLKKRNGFGQLGALPDTTYNHLTTYNGNLIAIGSSYKSGIDYASLAAYVNASDQWSVRGVLPEMSLRALPLVRTTTNQSQVDSVVSPSGLVCTVYTDDNSGGGQLYRYTVQDSTTGQVIVGPIAIQSLGGAVSGSPRVFLMANYFVIMYTKLVAGPAYNLDYVAIPLSAPTTVTTTVTLSTTYIPNTHVNFDGIVAEGKLYFSWNASASTIKVSVLSATLVQGSTVTVNGHSAVCLCVGADTSVAGSPIIYVAFHDPANQGAGNYDSFVFAVNSSLATVLAPTVYLIKTSTYVPLSMTCVGISGGVKIFQDQDVGSAAPTDAADIRIDYNIVTQAGAVTHRSTNLKRYCGLASKAFQVGITTYLLVIYSQLPGSLAAVTSNQPTYFILDENGNTVGKLAYANGGNYYTVGLPSVTVTGSVVQMAYLFKDLLAPVNKSQGLTTPNGLYSQTGINLASFDFDPETVTTGEIGQSLNISGGVLWNYDGNIPVENGFHLYPEFISLSAAVGGSMTNQQYYYVAVYEWSDNQGNLFRSAPSIPQGINLTVNNSVTVLVRSLYATQKPFSSINIVLYRWSVGQPIYYQVTSITAPFVNGTVSFLDTLADTSIIGNTILYTNGGVIENIGPPATDNIALYKSRLWLIDADDRNLLWYSKQVVEQTPVEMSDLFTLYVAATSTGSQGSSGVLTALSAMDDKLIMFKEESIYYLTGQGPDNTGANNDFSDPIFITATVGTTNQNSIVFIPNGIMFQSPTKGIWLLERGLGTSYIGAPVEAYNDVRVTSAVNIPNSNQVRFTLEGGGFLLYDYYFNQWGTFPDLDASSSTIFEDLQSYIDSSSNVFQETPGIYLDGANPVLMKFTTSWLDMAGLQGFERFKSFFFIGDYLSPHTLTVSLYKDYEDVAFQTSEITPDSADALEQWQVYCNTQKCQAFQIKIQENFLTSAGAGLTLSGLDCIIGVKGKEPKLKASLSVG